MAFKIHLLDMGKERYGDCVLCQFDQMCALVDGGHPRDFERRVHEFPSIPEQLEALLGHPAPFEEIGLLVVTHVHSDHIGCLPRLVADGVIKPKWALVADEKLGFGRPVAAGPDPTDALPVPARRVVAALREESRADILDDAQLAAFFEDAIRLEPAYIEMLQSLERGGTKVVRYGRDDHSALEAEFASIGLHILGPSVDHLLICAQAIADLTADSAERLSSQLAALPAVDSSMEAGLYRTMADPPGPDAPGMPDRPGKGAALNNQSIVLSLGVDGKKALLTGDMQFAKPEVRGLDPYMDDLVDSVVRAGPYDFIKLSHHASYNGLDAGILGLFEATRRFGISGGIDDPNHPDPGVLNLLQENRSRIQWSRTDRNGLVTVTFGSGLPQLRRNRTFGRGELSDPSPNSTDTAAPAESEGPSPAGEGGEARPGSPQPSAMTPSVTRHVIPGAGAVEVIARIPHVATRVTLTIEIEPRADLGPEGARAPDDQAPPPPANPPGRTPGALPTSLNIAGGRELPRLLFATSRAGLRRSIGAREADFLLAELARAGQVVFDAIPDGQTNHSRAAAMVQERLDPSFVGVVLLGGYDVVPPENLDVLPRAVRARLGATRDQDRFRVWCDEVYGGPTDPVHGLPSYPVTRIPDGRDPYLVFAAVQAGRGGNPPRRFGVHNVNRPFASSVFQGVGGAGNLLTSEKTTPLAIPVGSMGSESVYLMLHGSDVDGTRFWGEYADGDFMEAVNLSNIQAPAKAVIFTGCCWGALCADTPAVRAIPGRAPTPRLAGNSVALKCIESGALAFIGCTGEHYSPGSPYNYFGAPMHDEFWKAYKAGSPPARALNEAKRNFRQAMPHGRTDPLEQAIELKILRQYTCLGLAW